MTDGAALLAAVARTPGDDTPRLAYADWLDENDRPGAAAAVRAVWAVEEKVERLDETMAFEEHRRFRELRSLTLTLTLPAPLPGVRAGDTLHALVGRDRAGRVFRVPRALTVDSRAGAASDEPWAARYEAVAVGPYAVEAP